MAISLSSGPYLFALASRLVTTCVSRGASPVTTGRSSGIATRSTWRRWVRRPAIRSSASSTTCASATGWRRMPSWPDSMRTLSSRLSIRRVRRSVPRCSDWSSSPRRSRGIGSSPSSISSSEASCAESGVRNSCEMLASTVSRARRTASSSVSSRRTCTCRPPAGAALVITIVRGSPLACRYSVACALPSSRAVKIGQLKSQGRRPSTSRGLRTSPQNLPISCLRGARRASSRPAG